MAVIVVLNEGVDPVAFTESLEFEWSGYANFPGIFLVHATPEDFEGDSRIESVELDQKTVRGADQALLIDAQLGGASWGIARMIRRSAPWPTSRLQFPWPTLYRCERDAAGVDLYWMDTGIRETHQEFGGRVTRVYEAVSSSGLGDDNGHGTGTSSCGAGATVGLARGAHIFSFKVLDASNAGLVSWLLSGLDEAATHYQSRAPLDRPAVMNMSLQGYSSAVNAAITSTINTGMVIVACAGNAMQDMAAGDFFPAESDPQVIVVGGIGAADIPYYASTVSASNWGDRVDISAPSQRIYRASNSGDEAFSVGSNGTSFGSGYVAGMVGCLLQGHHRLTTRSQVEAVRAHVIATATTGHLKNAFGMTLPDRIAYLRPDIEPPEAIPGL